MQAPSETPSSRSSAPPYDEVPFPELIGQWFAGVATLGSTTVRLALADTKLALNSGAQVLFLVVVLAFQIVAIWLIAMGLVVMGLEMTGLSRFAAVAIVLVLQILITTGLVLQVGALSKNMRFSATTGAIRKTLNSTDSRESA